MIRSAQEVGNHPWVGARLQKKEAAMNAVTGFFLTILLAFSPGLAGAWVADNRHHVDFVSETVFEVVGRPGSGGQEFWCAAGDFARRALGAGAAQRVYLVRGPAPAQTRNWNRAVLFSLVPPQGADLSTMQTLSVDRVGDNLNVTMAQSYCVGNKVHDF